MTDENIENKIDDEDKKFIMNTGNEIRKLIISSLNKKYRNDLDKMKMMFLATLSNSLINILNDVSTDEDAFQHNLSMVMKTYNQFITREGLTKVTYNVITDELTGTH